MTLQPTLDLTTSRLAAVTHLISTARNQRSWDIVLATVFEILESGPKTLSDLVLGVSSQWPGVTVDEVNLEIALGEALARGLVVSETSLHGEIWTGTSLAHEQALVHPRGSRIAVF
jgi:hypothetical protein